MLIGTAVGMLGAVKRYSLFDSLATTGALFALSFPTFWFGLMAIYMFAVKLRWLPSGGMYELGNEGDPMDLVRHLILPTMVLALVLVATWSRYARSSFLEVIHQDYIRTARAKGLVERDVMLKHALPERSGAADRAVRHPAADAVLRRPRHRDHLRLARHGSAVRRQPDHEGISRS